MPKRQNKYADSFDVAPRTREILQNERWYGNGPPHWTTGKAKRPAKTAEEAHENRLRLIKRLRKHLQKSPETEALLVRLKSCDDGSRCHSAACPECARAYTRWFVQAGRKLLKALATETSVLSLVHDQLRVPLNELTARSVQKAKRKIQTILTKAGVTTYVGGIDISANEDETGRVEPYYQIQTWILAPTDQVRAAERKLRKTFPRTELTSRPVKIQAWDGNVGALAYSLKSTFDRRVSYLRKGSEDGSQHACRNTRDRPPRVKQHIELAITLDRVGLHARLHLAGCRVVHTADGPMIRLIRGEKGEGRRVRVIQ
jgi:hypothetical protein